MWSRLFSKRFVRLRLPEHKNCIHDQYCNSTELYSKRDTIAVLMAVINALAQTSIEARSGYSKYNPPDPLVRIFRRRRGL